MFLVIAPKTKLPTFDPDIGLPDASSSLPSESHVTRPDSNTFCTGSLYAFVTVERIAFTGKGAGVVVGVDDEAVVAVTFVTRMGSLVN